MYQANKSNFHTLIHQYLTNKLAEHKIAVNPVSAYYHDHLFVPVSRTQEVMMLLQEFSK